MTISTNYEVFQRLQELVELPRNCISLTLKLDLGSSPTIDAVFIPEIKDHQQEPVKKTFRLVPIGDD